MNSTKWLIILLVLNIILRLPTWFDPVSYGDECIYLVLGQALRKGLVFYRDIHDNKPPLLYLMAALVNGQQVWFRVLTTAWTTINAWFIYRLAAKLIKKDWLIYLSGILFIFFSITLEGRIPNGENYMILPVTVAVWLMVQKKSWWWAGVLLSVGFLFKIPVVFDFIALVLAFFVFRYRSFKEITLHLFSRKAILLTVGFMLPILLSIFYYWTKGAFDPYVKSALLQNLGYLSSWSNQAQQSGFLERNRGLLIRAAILAVTTAFLFIKRRSLGFTFTMLSLWFSYALFGALLSGRPYPHYLVQLIPAGSLLIPFVLNYPKNWRVLTTGYLLTLLVVAYGLVKFWHYPLLAYYRNFFQFSTGQIDRQQYFAYFGDKVLTDYQVATYLKEHTAANERTFIWGDGACIYALSDRLPVGRYTVNYHIFDFDGFDQTWQSIKDKNPNIIIKLTSEKRSFPQLDAILAKQYLLAATIGEAKIYHQVFR
jgi:hypothetical protein